METKEFIVARVPVRASPLPKPVHSAAPALPLRAACSSAGHSCGQHLHPRAAISWPETAAFRHLPLPQTGSAVCWQQGSGRKECPCKWCIVLLRACCIVFAAQGRNIPGSPSVLSGLSIKSPSSSASFFTVYFAALVKGTNCRCLPVLLPLPPTLLESPILPRETAAATGETELPRSRAAFPAQCC